MITRGGRIFHRTAECTLLREGQRYAERRRGDELHDPVFVPFPEALAGERAARSARVPHYRPAPAQPPSRNREPGAAPNSATRATGAEALDTLAHALIAASQAIVAALAADADRSHLTDLVAHAHIDIRAQVWPNATPLAQSQPGQPGTQS